MKNDYIDLIEPTPVLKTKKCQIIAFLLKFLLQFTPVFTALIVWYMYDYFIAGATLLITFIVVGIVRAKMRNSVIPLSQREYHYNDEGIAKWFTAKELCPKEKD
ncbi:hypothetical protein [Sulfurimonas hydrogeniphila]|nr:hypothetical protein [Sulfurimonas hydrogeniphila]